MAQPTKQQWEEIKHKLSGPYGTAYLKCDDYIISAQVEQSKMKLVVSIYVNGWIKGQDLWRGKESKINQMGDIARRFHCCHRISVPAKTVTLNIKILGKKQCKEKGCNEARVWTYPQFGTPGAFIAHLKKHNPSIEVLDYLTYRQLMDALPKEAEDKT
jgi:hypothetical protein